MAVDCLMGLDRHILGGSFSSILVWDTHNTLFADSACFVLETGTVFLILRHLPNREEQIKVMVRSVARLLHTT